MKLLLLLPFLVFLLLLVMHVDVANARTKQGRRTRNLWACAGDIVKYCGLGRDKHATVEDCLELHSHLLSDPCREKKTIYSQKVPSACFDDMQHFCSKIKTTDGTLSCLRNMRHLSDECRNALPDRSHFEELADELKFQSVDGDCTNHILRLCGGVVPGDGRLRKCIKDHWDTLASSCKFERQSRREHIPQSCAGDAAKLCRKMSAGDNRITGCLLGNEDKLSGLCRVSLKMRLIDLDDVCAHDVHEKCSNVPINHDSIVECLKEHEAHLRYGCTTRKLRSKHHYHNQRPGDCSEEVRKFCRGVKGGHGLIRLCLALKIEELSQKCFDLLPADELLEHLAIMNESGTIQKDMFARNVLMDPGLYEATDEAARTIMGVVLPTAVVLLLPSSAALILVGVFIFGLVVKAYTRNYSKRTRVRRR